VRPRIEEELRAALAVDLPALDNDSFLRHLDRMCQRAGQRVRLHFILHGAIAPALAGLEFLSRDTPALSGVRTGDLVAGLSEASSRPGRELRELAAFLRARPALLARARTEQPDVVDPVFGARFRAWITTYGHRI